MRIFPRNVTDEDDADDDHDCLYTSVMMVEVVLILFPRNADISDGSYDDGANDDDGGISAQ